MTSVEKRRSGRKSGSHRKHSDGGYSDTSSAGSFLDETDREVSNLTDRAFRSLCIGDEAVYNDSDLGASPCAQRERQLAFGQSELDRGREDAEREELKRAAHESFSLRVQQYGQDWIHGGMYGAEIHRDPQWEVYGERTQGRVSATFQHSFLETSQQEESLRREQLCYLSNGATELGSQQRRSRSRVSSLIRAFNSEGQRDGAGLDGKVKEWNDEQSWDKSALMSIQRELSEFSTSYQQNFNSSHFPSAGPLSCQDTNFYSSEVASAAHMNPASSFMRSSHSKHSMSAQVNCNSNFFIHSEFSPFRVWRDHNRFPFQQGEVSGFMHCSEFPKWYETPMYKELSLEAPSHSSYRFDDRGTRHPRNNMAPVVPPTPSRSTSSSTVLQKTLAVEKRCESELAGYPHRKRMQSMGTNRLPSQRPSTASPTVEMSRRVQDTISSVKALQQKIKMMTEQNMTSGMTNQQGMLYSSNDLLPFDNYSKTVASNVVSSNTSTTPFNISQLLTPSVHAHQEVETSEVRQYAASPQPVEHAPVRAESRGATPDVRMSSYKSRASSLLFNLKDNRKRVKSTYSPTKFKGLETHSAQGPRDTVIDIPDFPDPDQFAQVDNFSRTIAASHQYEHQYHNPGSAPMTAYSQPATTHTGQYSEYTSSDYQQAQMQSEMVHHSGFSGFVPTNYTTNQLANGQNLHEDVSSFTPYKQGMMDNVETMGGYVPKLQSSHTPAEMPRLNADSNQRREYLIRKDNREQQFNETAGKEFTKVEQRKNNNHDYSNVSSQDRWRQTASQEAEFFSVKSAISPWKQETSVLMEKDQHAAAYQREAAITEELNLPRDKYRGEIQQSINKEPGKIELRENLGVGTSPHKKVALVDPNISDQMLNYPPVGHQTVENPTYYEQQLPGVFKDRHEFQKYYGQNKRSETKDSYLTQNYNNTYIDPEYGNQRMIFPDKDKTVPTQEMNEGKPVPQGHEIPSLQLTAAKPQFEYDMQKKSFSVPDNTSAATMANQEEHFVEVKASQAMAEQKKAQHAQAELAKAQPSAQVEQPKVESAGLILAGQTCSEKVKGEETKAGLAEQEKVKQAKAEHAQEKKGKGEQTVRAREEQIKAGQTKADKVMVPKMFTDEAGNKHMGEVWGEQVKAKQPEAEGLKEEAIKTEQAKTKQAGQTRIKQATTEQTLSETIKAQQVEKEQLRAEQIAKEQMEAEQIRAEKVKAEQSEAERKKAQQAEQEQIKEQQAKVKQEKIEAAEDGSVQVGQANAEQLKTQMHKAKEEKVKQRKEEQPKLEQSKEELTKAERTKTDSVQKCLNQPLAKLRETQQVRSEPDKVEQVKTELAKAKAELAKIKEKMRGDQKEKVRNTILTKEDVMKKDVPLGVNTDKNVKSDQDQAPQIHQQKKDLDVNKQTNQVDRGTNEYERLREKYGFTDSTSTQRNKQPAAGAISTNDGTDTLHQVEKPTNEKLKDKSGNTSNLDKENMGNKVQASSFKASDAAECHYVYSESSKEFKLVEPDNLPSHRDRANTNNVIDKVTASSVEKLPKCDPPRHSEVSQQKDVAKAPPPERKPKEKSLSQKERAQTKQEILTSKIKAHAEKEISAIKEKGFALRDGFMSKTSNKQLLGSQSVNIRQKPPSQEGPKKHESKMHSNTTPKQQMEPSGIQMEPDKSVSTPSSATTPAKTLATTCQVADLPQKNVPKEPMKSNNSVPKPAREAEQMGGHIRNTENLNKENLPIIASPIQSKGQEAKPKQETEISGEILGKQKEKLKDSLSINSIDLNKKIADSSRATALVKAESCKPMTTEESKQETVHEVSAPTLNLAFSQNVADNDLQITGIMVTVRERTPPVENIVRNSSNEDHIKTKENKCSNSEKDGRHLSSGLDVSSGGKPSQEDGKRRVTDKVEQSTTVKEDQTTVTKNNQVECVQNILPLETRQSSTTENISVKKANLQQVSSPTNARPQIQHQDAHPENAGTCTVSVPAKNKALPETQSLLYKQDMITSETKDYTNKMSKESLAKSLWKDEVMNNTEEKNQEKRPTINMTDLNKVHVKPQIKYDTQQILKEDMTKAMTVINPSISRNVDVETTTPVEDYESTPPKSFNKTGLPIHLMENKNPQVSTEHQPKETNTWDKGQVDNDLHIGGISIRVVPAVAVSSSNDTKVNNLNNEGRSRTGPSSLEAPPELKINGNQQNSKNNTGLNTEDENGMPENIHSNGKSVDESKIQPTEGDYFQVQGIAETRDEAHNGKNVSLSSQAVSKGGELPGLLPNNAAISDDSHKQRKNEGFTGSLLDQSEIKTVDSSSANVRDVTMKSRNKETNLAPKQSDPQRDRSNKNEKAEASQAVHTRKQHTENHCSPSGMERQRGLHPSRETTVKETPEVKPKPREKVSTIPEISAIADYARLKVIVSEDRANTIQEFPPNKKEGFFPLIQTRHSRRPAFAADPQDPIMKEKSLPNKTEISSKVNKEPKPVAFPITEKEHQRTGMFKLGDKEKQEKMVFDPKVTEGVVDTGAKQMQHLKEKMPTTRHEETTAKQIRMEQMEPEHDSRIEKVKPREDLKIKHMIEERRASLAEEERRAAQREEERRTREREAITMKIKERREKQRQAEEERKAKQAEEERVAQKEKMRAKQIEEARRLKEIEEGRKIIIEEGSRAKLREEEEQIKESEERRRVKQQEEEFAAREEQRRRAAEEEKQRKAAEEDQRRRAAEEEKQRKAAEEEQQRRAAEEQLRRAAEEEKRRRAAEEEQRKRAAEEGKQRAAEEEKRRRAAEEEQRRRAAEEEKRRAAEEEKRRAAEEEQRRRAAEEEKRRAAEEEQRRRAAEEEKRRAAEEQRKRAAEEEKRRAAEEEKRRRAAEEEQRRRAAEEEKQRRAAEEEKRRRAAEEEQRRRAAEEEKLRRAAEEEKRRRAAEEEQQRRAAEEEQRRRAAEEEKQRAAEEEQRRRAAEEEKRRRAAEEEQRRRAAEEEKQRKAAEEEQRRRAAEEEQRRRAAEEEKRRAAEEEQRRRAAEEEKRRAAEEEQRKRAAEEEKRRAAEEEKQRRAAEEQRRRAAEEEKQRRAAEEEQRRRAAEEEKQRRAAEEEKWRAAEEQRRRAAEEEKQRRAAEEEKRRAAEEQRRRAADEEKRRAAEEEQRRRAAEEEKQRRAAEEEQRRAAEEQKQRAAEEQQRKAEEEQHRRAAEKEQQRRAAEEQQRKAEEEQQRRVAEEEQRRKAAEEGKRRAAEEEQRRAAEEKWKAAEKEQRRAAKEEQRRKAAEEEKRRAAEEEQQRRAAEEEQKKAAEEKQQRRAAEEEQRRRAAEEEKRRAAEEEQRRRAAEEQQRKAIQEEQQRRAALIEEQQRRAAQEEHKRRAEQEEQQRRAALIEEQQRRAAQEEQQRRTTQEQQRRAVQDERQRTEQEEQQRRSALIEDQRRKQREDKTAQMLEEERIKQTRELQRAEHQAEKQRAERRNREEWMTSDDSTVLKYRQEKQARGETTRRGKESQTALKEEERGAREWMLAQREDEVRAKKREENLDVYREKEHAAQMEEQKRAAQRMDTLQYYSITSAETEKTNKRQQGSPVPFQRKSNVSGHDPAEETRPYRPYTPASPAPSLPRSNTSSPALGAKPSMFRVKDNTLRGSSLTKSVKPRFHKNIGEDFRVGSPMGSDRGEEEQDIMRHSAGTPVHPGTGLNRLAAVKESSTCQTASLSQDYPGPPSHYRPRSRRSIALEEDDSRSIISNMSEDVESFATSAADLADIRGLYDYERPESACSFSSDVSRSLGKPPAVPPKSEKALRRAKRLTTRRMKKELARAVTGSPTLPEGSSFPTSSSTEVHCSNRHAVASPHFSSPVSLAHAPTPGSSLPVSHSEHQSSHSYASPHATGPISIPLASPHATAPVSIPVVPPHTAKRASHPAAPKLVPDVPSSPTLYQTNHPVPVTQYHVESGLPQSYPLTQRRVLQDLGSGQYFVVDVPVQVKTKTFFDPDTGKYVQLNVRESTKSGPRAQPQQTYLEPQLQSQIHAMPQQQHLPQDSPAGKPLVLYQGYPGYTQGYQPAAINSVHDNKSAALAGHYNDQKLARGNHGYRYPNPQSSEEHRNSPEKTPYMDTVNNTDKTYNTVYNAHSPYQLLPDREKNQIAGGSVCENENTPHSRYQPCDIIPVSELDDLMELSDW